jgi:hypothetical protein
MVLEAAQADPPNQFFRPVPSNAFFYSSDLKRNLDVLAQRTPGQEIVFLRDVTDFRANLMDRVAAKNDATGS